MSNYESNSSNLLGMKAKKSEVGLFGYCLSSDIYRKNQCLDLKDYISIKDNNIDFSGVYSAVNFEGGKAEIIIDPLCQFNLFYFSNGERFILSSSIDAIRKYLGIKEVNKEYLYDQIAYQSPMRGLTILKEVYYIQYDDVAYNHKSRSQFIDIDTSDLIKIHRPDYSKYDELSYSELINLYLSRLNARAEVICSVFDKVHVQLTGGADSRLALSSFKSNENIECYVYGNGENQNRLIFQEILSARNVSPVSKINFVGQPLNNPSRIIKGLVDSNFLKSNNLNTYMNGPLDSSENYCKITGYYGANVCGGVVLPPKDTKTNARIKMVPESLFTYHHYVEGFLERNSDLRASAFNDLFYINNRGKGHYAAHSIADNKNVSSIDILYDYINLILVKKCPYSDWEIDKNAISIDLIYGNDKQLALFPYDSRKIPKYKFFDNIPLINCFDGYTFPSKELKDFEFNMPRVDTSMYNLLNIREGFLSIKEMFNIAEIKELAGKYKGLDYLVEQNDIQANIFLYFILGELYLNS
ncbi:TPA: hypothetical protein NJ192_000221 [Vibrio parahaemolyticus]|nr:hypothetical protein [Vibrio parahaemolyticus]HCG6494758.1 hypothetical protein [Vibrio parahaemolyticus]